MNKKDEEKIAGSFSRKEKKISIINEKEKLESDYKNLKKNHINIINDYLGYGQKIEQEIENMRQEISKLHKEPLKIDESAKIIENSLKEVEDIYHIFIG